MRLNECLGLDEKLSQLTKSHQLDVGKLEVVTKSFKIVLQPCTIQP